MMAGPAADAKSSKLPWRIQFGSHGHGDRRGQVSMRIIAIHRSVRSVSALCFSRDRRGAGLAR